MAEVDWTCFLSLEDTHACADAANAACADVPPLHEELADSSLAALAERGLVADSGPLSARRLAVATLENWEAMPEGCMYHEAPLYVRAGGVWPDASGAVEVREVLAEAFGALMFAPGDSLATVLARVRQACNYEIVGVWRVQNIPRAGMHGSFKQIYATGRARTVYHGTTPQNALHINRVGFRGSCCQRAKWGKGIYAAADVWQALAYAEPAADMTQTVLVVQLLEGPTRVGSPNLSDFGLDALGRQVLTTTDPAHTVFCASHGDQLLSSYRIEARLLPGPHTCSHKQAVHMYHPAVHALVHPAAPAPPPPLFALAEAAAAVPAPAGSRPVPRRKRLFTKAKTARL